MATTNKRKTTSRSTAARRAASTKAQKRKDYAIKREAFLLATLAVCVLLFLSNFNIIGVVGEKISNVMFGLFGMISYVFPVALFLLILYLSANPGNRIAKRKSIFTGIMIFDIGIILDIINGWSGETHLSYSAKEIFTWGIEKHKGGGIISASISYALCHKINYIGTMIVVFLVLAICFMVMTEKSILGKVKDQTDVFKEKSEENRELRRQYWEDKSRLNEEKAEEKLKKEELRKSQLKSRYDKKLERDMEKERERKQKAEQKELIKEAKDNDRILRKDMKVSGVTFNTTIVKEPDKNDVSSMEDIHEINVNGFDPRSIDEIGEVKINYDDVDASTDDNEEEILIIEDEKEVIDEIKEAPVLGPGKSTNHSSSIGNIEIKREPSVKTSKPNSDDMADVKKQAEASMNTTVRQYRFPPLTLLKKNDKKGLRDSESSIRDTAAKLIDTLRIFGVNATVKEISQGPTVTRFELEPERGVKVSRIKSLSDDIKLGLAAADIRIEAPIPGKSAVGIEVPNKVNSAVLLRDLIDTPEFKNSDSKLTFAVGKDIAGKTIVYDIDKFPHLLIAGATGSGKSVCINTLIMSIIYKADPDDVKLIMIDPKVVELSIYNGIPHLMIPVVTQAKKASAALNWAVAEMMERYKKFEDMKVRDLEGYNNAVKDMDSELYKKLPQIVLIVDELADLMMVAKNEVEDSICRLAQLARACGIHLVIATQRPSVDVITGLIKANMPSRIAFAVSSGVDSRTILDMNGAEELLGKGDMLFFPKGLKNPVRLQGGYVSDSEVNAVVSFLKDKCPAVYDSNIESSINSGNSSGVSQTGDDSDASFDEFLVDAAKLMIEKDKASIGMLQRAFRIGFNRAARIMDKLAEKGVVSEEEGTKPRRVLMNMEELENLIENNEL